MSNLSEMYDKIKIVPKSVKTEKSSDNKSNNNKK